MVAIKLNTFSRFSPLSLSSCEMIFTITMFSLHSVTIR